MSPSLEQENRIPVCQDCKIRVHCRQALHDLEVVLPLFLVCFHQCLQIDWKHPYQAVRNDRRVEQIYQSLHLLRLVAKLQLEGQSQHLNLKSCQLRYFQWLHLKTAHLQMPHSYLPRLSHEMLIDVQMLQIRDVQLYLLLLQLSAVKSLPRRVTSEFEREIVLAAYRWFC